MDTAYFFTTFLRRKIDDNRTAALALGRTYSFMIEGAGTWHVDLSTDPATIVEADVPGCTCWLTATKDDFEFAINNPSQIIRLLLKGRIRLSDPMGFQGLMKL